MIYNKEPQQVLWDMVKEISDTIPVYKEVMYEEPEDTPESYIVLRSQVSDSTEIFGDGVSQVRSADCDIMLISKGYADDSTDLHNKNKKIIREHLKSQNISFSEFNLGYSDSLKSTQHTFSLAVSYNG